MLMKNLLIMTLAALIALGLAGCPASVDDDGGGRLPEGIVMTTAISGPFVIALEGTDLMVDWGDGSPVVKETGYSSGDKNHNYDDNTEHTITITGNVYGLECVGMKLKSLDLRAAKDLDYLHCGNNSLTRLDLSRNTALKLIYCNNNSLKRLNVSKSKALKELDYSNNKIPSLDLSKNTALEGLWCDGNSIPSLTVSRNIALKVLSCNDNSLKSLNLSKNIALEKLYCDDNSLSSLDLSKNTRLEFISCDTNKMTTAAALNNLFRTLPTRSDDDKGLIYISGNLGAGTCDDSIATVKNWVVGR